MSTPDEVRQLIVDAFSGVPISSGNDIILDRYIHVAGDFEILPALKGQHWQTIKPNDIAPWSFFFRCFSPEAFRHYLPPLLLAGLDDFGQPFGKMYTAGWAISPSDHTLYSMGRDNEFEHRISLLTPLEREAVTAFMALLLVDQVLSEYPSYPLFAVARAFRFGWDQFDVSVRPRFRAFDERMRNFEHTPPDDPDARAVYDQIFEAFAQTPYPGDSVLASPDTGGDEPAESALDFRAIKWQKVHPHLIANHYTALSFLSPEGLRYFLPAFLITDLCGYESNADPVVTLTHGFAPPMESPELSDEILAEVAKRLPKEMSNIDDIRKRMREREELTSSIDWFAYGVKHFESYSRVEREAVIRYLEFRAVDEIQPHQIEAALERYWRPSLDGSRSF